MKKLVYTTNIINVSEDATITSNVWTYYANTMKIESLNEKIAKAENKIARIEKKIDNAKTDAEKTVAEDLLKGAQAELSELEYTLVEVEAKQEKFEKDVQEFQAKIGTNNLNNVENVIRLTLCAKSMRSMVRYAFKCDDSDFETLDKLLEDFAKDESDMQVLPTKAIIAKVGNILKRNMFVVDSEVTKAHTFKWNKTNCNLLCKTYIKDVRPVVKGGQKKGLTFDGYDLKTRTRTDKEGNKDYSELSTMIAKLSIEFLF